MVFEFATRIQFSSAGKQNRCGSKLSMYVVNHNPSTGRILQGSPFKTTIDPFFRLNNRLSYIRFQNVILHHKKFWVGQVAEVMAKITKKEMQKRGQTVGAKLVVSNFHNRGLLQSRQLKHRYVQ